MAAIVRPRMLRLSGLGEASLAGPEKPFGTLIMVSPSGTLEGVVPNDVVRESQKHDSIEWNRVQPVGLVWYPLCISVGGWQISVLAVRYGWVAGHSDTGILDNTILATCVR